MTVKSRVLTTNFKMFVQQHTGQQVTLCVVFRLPNSIRFYNCLTLIKYHAYS